MWHNRIINQRRLTQPGAPIVYTKFDIFYPERILKSSHGECYFGLLPRELKLRIIEECDFLTIYMFYKTCKKANNLIKINIQWFIYLLQSIKLRLVYS